MFPTAILAILATVCVVPAAAVTKSFVNTSMPMLRPTFVVNFDMATVICQHSADGTDLHLHELSVLCDGKIDCFDNPAMHDESLPYCTGTCSPTCTRDGACLSDGRSAQCFCNSGHHGVDCALPDANECSAKPCHWLAHCRNTFGSYYCTCLPGFDGDGHSCVDMDECATGQASCPAHARCVNLPGTYLCNCSAGFMPKGLPVTHCEDIDECKEGLAHCAVGRLCENTVGSYRCVEQCGDGFVEERGMCLDVDECEMDVCGRRAKCTNTAGNYRCDCERGFVGDGVSCSPLTDCSQDEGVCDRHAFCIPALRMCLCADGFIGDGITCYDVDECAIATANCKLSERCLNVDGSFLCCDAQLTDMQCKKAHGATCMGGCGLNARCVDDKCRCRNGFSGDAQSRCTDINECDDVADMCPAPGEWCVNTQGGHYCCSPESPIGDCHGLSIERVVTPSNVITARSTTAAPIASVGGSSTAPSRTKITTTNPSLITEIAGGRTSSTRVRTSERLPTSKADSETPSSWQSATKPPSSTASTSRPTTPTTTDARTTAVTTNPVATTSSRESTPDSPDPTTSGSTRRSSDSTRDSRLTESTDSATSAMPHGGPPTDGQTTSGHGATTKGQVPKTGQSVSATSVTTLSPATPLAPVSTTVGANSVSPRDTTADQTASHGASTEANGSSALTTSAALRGGSTASTGVTSNPATTAAGTSGAAGGSWHSSSAPATAGGERTGTTATAMPATMTRSTGDGPTTGSDGSDASRTTSRSQPKPSTLLPVGTAHAGRTTAGSATMSSAATPSSTTTSATNEQSGTRDQTPLATASAQHQKTTSSPTLVLEHSTASRRQATTTLPRISATHTAPFTSSTETENEDNVTEQPNTLKTTTAGSATVTNQETSASGFAAPTVSSSTAPVVSTAQSASSQKESSTPISSLATAAGTSVIESASTASPNRPVGSVSPVMRRLTTAETTADAGRVTTRVEIIGSTAKPTSPEDSAGSEEVVTPTPTRRTTTDEKAAAVVESRSERPTATRLSTTKATFELTTTTAASLTVVEPRAPAVAVLARRASCSERCVTDDDCDSAAFCDRRLRVCRCRPGYATPSPSTFCRDVDECATGKAVCADGALCRNFAGGYSCACEPGFRLVNDQCEDIDECSERWPCGANATCTNAPGSYRCECLPNFNGDGYYCVDGASQRCSHEQQKLCDRGRTCSVDAARTVVCGACSPGYHLIDGNCTDVDECSAVAICGARARCINTEGSFDCVCREGFRGDGQLCEDVNECGESPCHPQATCANVVGSFACVCPAGWQGDGSERCWPSSSPACGRADVCPARSRCLTVDGAAVCQCAAGFRSVGGNCEDVNECADNKHDCGTHAFCRNTIGSFDCDCRPGFTGSDGHCRDIDECSSPDYPCHSDADCTNGYGGFTCSCSEGFTGSGFNCSPLPRKACSEEETEACAARNRSCQVGADGEEACAGCLGGHLLDGAACRAPTGCDEASDCDANADCFDLAVGSHLCACRRGFIGDGRRCDDVDECSLSSVCSAWADCENTVGSFECVCHDGFDGDGLSCSLCPNGVPHELSSCQQEDVCPAGYACVGPLCCPSNSSEISTSLATTTSSTVTRTTCGDTVCPNSLPCKFGRCDCAVGERMIGGSCTRWPIACDADDGGCGLNAVCISDHCVCNAGYTGDGDTCLSLDVKVPCLFCGDHAVCEGGACACAVGFFGNGALCVADPDDCVAHLACAPDAICHAPTRRCRCAAGLTGDGAVSCTRLVVSCADDAAVCDAHASCVAGQCRCDGQFEGDGLVCAPAVTPSERSSTESATTVGVAACAITHDCHADADCFDLQPLGSGYDCRCHVGFTGDGRLCHDIDECADHLACGALAVCQNNVGGFRCSCPDGFVGDPYSFCQSPTDTFAGIDVECEPDGIVLVFSVPADFSGKVFVRSQSENPRCSMELSKANESSGYRFKALFDYCDIVAHPDNLFSTTIIIQKHRYFLTEAADAFDLQCAYPTGVKDVMSHVNVSSLTTIGQVTQNGPPSRCELTVADALTGDAISEAVVGQQLQLQLTIAPAGKHVQAWTRPSAPVAEIYAASARDCVAVNMDNGETYALTDAAGCAVDPALFPDWTRTSPARLIAHFRSFKWPDTYHLRFQCVCAACIDRCEEVDCDRHRLAAFQQRARRLRRSPAAATERAFSRVLTVRDAAEEAAAERALERWSRHLDDDALPSTVDERCLSADVVAIAVAIAACCVGVLLTSSKVLRTRRRAGAKWPFTLLDARTASEHRRPRARFQVDPFFDSP